eukprot:TRINITY_DN68113_c0_g1_i1.p1 TRINITY_DN68113_c0_g1~~TRINITY_DN68113_c0_g1_i1.p1  ORF type:complete len:382 (-),score=42.92 TRINITY_DN68113_c0_g1_i1:70-1215(-)
MGNVVQPLWEPCPMMTRMVVAGYPALSLALALGSAAGVSSIVDNYFVCNIWNLESFKVWTLFIGPFFQPMASGMAFLMVLFEIYMVMIHFPSREREFGSLTFLLWIFLMNALTNTVYLLAQFVMSLMASNPYEAAGHRYQNMRGLWPMVMVCLTLSSLSNPDGMQNFWGLVNIPSKWYPIALTGFFCLLNGMRIMWSLVAGLVVGYAYTKLGVERLLPSRVRADRIEQRFCRGGRCGLLGAAWIPASSTNQFDVDSGDRRYANLSDFGHTGRSQGNSGQNRESSSSGWGFPTSTSFQAFAGSGNRLGESDELVPVPSRPGQSAESPATQQVPSQSANAAAAAALARQQAQPQAAPAAAPSSQPSKETELTPTAPPPDTDGV